VTWKGLGHDPNMVGTHYLENTWRYRLRYNGTLMGNGHVTGDVT